MVSTPSPRLCRRSAGLRFAGSWVGLALVLLAAPALAAGPAIPLDPPRRAQAPEPLCYCWNDGRKIDEGLTSCIRTTQGRRLASCGRVLNNMSWHVTENPCPET